MLHRHNVEEFLDAWLASEYHNWKYVGYAIDNRYSEGRLDRHLSEEKQWALDLYAALKARQRDASEFKALRILRVIPKSLVQLSKTVTTT